METKPINKDECCDGRSPPGAERVLGQHAYPATYAKLEVVRASSLSGRPLNLDRAMLSVRRTRPDNVEQVWNLVELEGGEWRAVIVRGDGSPGHEHKAGSLGQLLSWLLTPSADSSR